MLFNYVKVLAENGYGWFTERIDFTLMIRARLPPDRIHTVSPGQCIIHVFKYFICFLIFFMAGRFISLFDGNAFLNRIFIRRKETFRNSTDNGGSPTGGFFISGASITCPVMSDLIWVQSGDLAPPPVDMILLTGIPDLIM